jgi:3-dehydroquinate dehydratase-2
MANIGHPAEPRRRAARRRPKVLVLHGPSLNPLGCEDSAVRARESIATIDARLAAQARKHAVDLVAFQSDEVIALIDRVRGAVDDGVGFIVIDPAGLTHTSLTLRDALSALAIPFIEVHFANGGAREPFRQRSYFSDKTVGTIVGLGALGYQLALTYALRHVRD